MLPSGSSIVNPAYFEALTAKIGRTQTCEELQALTAEAFASITAMMDGAGSQMAIIKPILALLTAPEANPTAILTWLTSFITLVLTPYVKPFATYAATLAEVVVLVAVVEEAIATKGASFLECAVSIPSLPAIPV